MITLSLDSPLKLVIVSYRSNYSIREGCSCHPEYQTGDSDFDIGVVEGLQGAAEYIAKRLLEEIHSDHSHVIFEDFESALEVRNTSWDATDIAIPGEGEVIEVKVRNSAQATSPGPTTTKINTRSLRAPNRLSTSRPGSRCSSANFISSSKRAS